MSVFLNFNMTPAHRTQMMRRVTKTSGDGMMEQQVLFALLARLCGYVSWEKRVCLDGLVEG